MAWAPDYITASELKSYVRIDDSVDDAEVGFAITAASRAIDRATNRQFGVVGSAEARYYVPEWDRRRGTYTVAIDDLQSVSGLTVVTAQGVSVAAWAAPGDGGYILEPRNAAQLGAPWTLLVTDTATSDFTITALWGWTAVPSTIKQATLIQASRFLKRREAPFGVAGSPDLGSELRLLAKVDPDVEVMLGKYRRWWAAA